MPTIVSEPDYQYSLFGDERSEAIVNVASVPQRSPFRYPGGKTWLVPRIRRWLRSLPQLPTEFVEPFAGGAIIGLTVAFENLAERVTLVERDADVASVWHTILSDDAEWLANRIISFDLTAENVCDALAEPPADTRERAFQTILRNRVNRGGILAPGVGMLKKGENGKGITSRWYPQTLAKRITAIACVANRIRFIESDGLETLRGYVNRTDAVTFLDPPYTAAGKRAGARLYRHNELDHEELFRIADTLQGDFLMTYDNSEGVHALARRQGLSWLAIPMKSAHHTQMTELLVSRDLSWA